MSGNRIYRKEREERKEKKNFLATLAGFAVQENKE